MDWSSSSNIYSAFKDVLDVNFSGTEEKYYELTDAEMEKVIESIKEDIENSKKRLNARTAAYNAIKNIPKDAIDEYVDDYASTTEYIEELEQTLSYLKTIYDVIPSSDGYTSFEKALINIT